MLPPTAHDQSQELLGAADVLKLFFKLFRCPDKPLREMIYKHILGDIRRMNQKQKSGQINKKLQNFMYEMMQDTHPIAVRIPVASLAHTLHTPRTHAHTHARMCAHTHVHTSTPVPRSGTTPPPAESSCARRGTTAAGGTTCPCRESGCQWRAPAPRAHPPACMLTRAAQPPALNAQAKKSLELMVTLYRKNVWHDNKTVNVITTALFSPVAKVKVCALKFFLGADDDEDDDSDEEQEQEGSKSYADMLKNQAVKKTVSRSRASLCLQHRACNAGCRRRAHLCVCVCACVRAYVCVWCWRTASLQGSSAPSLPRRGAREAGLAGHGTKLEPAMWHKALTGHVTKL